MSGFSSGDVTWSSCPARDTFPSLMRNEKVTVLSMLPGFSPAPGSNAGSASEQALSPAATAKAAIIRPQALR
ncbi:hypothetical protein [uncultured Muribaculum sp.]|uniref:hypothetical protein n=1 Tax=uncultured Muribaculum sp. TaxID=1918613 RepID=UPI002731CC98|nr:hypothetical protein [uncultured Muribaculum sp.]